MCLSWTFFPTKNNRIDEALQCKVCNARLSWVQSRPFPGWRAATSWRKANFAICPTRQLASAAIVSPFAESPRENVKS